MDVRTVNGHNVLDLSDALLKEIKIHCEDASIKVQCVGSPINKVDYSPENRIAEVEKLKRAIHAAKILETSRIRLFSPVASWEERKGVLEWMGQMAEIASNADIGLLHENDAKFFGAYPSQEKWLLEQLPRETVKAAFDFSNAVMIGFDPMDDFYSWILPLTDTLHMKDFSRVQNQVVACGEGDGKILEFLTKAFQAGWSGALTLEPHLKSAGPRGGWSGPELFAYASQKMKTLATEAKRAASS